MSCCHISINFSPVFSPVLIYDAQRFSKYVGGANLVEIGVAQNNIIYNSALHLEMNMWPINSPMPLRRYHLNDHFDNAWKAMLAGWLNFKVGDNFTDDEKQKIKLNFKLPLSQGCNLHDFDKWILDLMLDLRQSGQNPARLPVLPINSGHTTSMASIGRCQKFINMFIKYELCWQAAGKFADGEFRHYVPSLSDLSKNLCALHAPIDRVLLNKIMDTSLGNWLIENNLVNGVGQFFQSTDGMMRPWSKLDCLRTYYGFQLLLRRLAFYTWPDGCACHSNSQETIRACADWFNKNYGTLYPQNVLKNTDWINATINIPDKIIEETLQYLNNYLSDNSTTCGNEVALPTQIIKPTKNDQEDFERDGSNLNCQQCQLGRVILQAHIEAIENESPEVPSFSGQQDIDHQTHRIRVTSLGGWAFQYHVNNNDVRVDRFSEGETQIACERYQHLCNALRCENHDFGNGIEGNERRSIRKLTSAGANAGVENFDRIAKEAVQIMSEIYEL